MARRKEASKNMKHNKAHATRMRRIKTANQRLHSMDIDSDGTPKRQLSQRQLSQPLPMDFDEIRQANDSEHVASVVATRTKPAMNKYQHKRLGAKKDKKLEIATNS